MSLFRTLSFLDRGRYFGAVSMAVASLVGLAAYGGFSSRVEACGGTFCDTGPNQMPVDQTGENILFVMGEGYVEAHIQIQYDPNTAADKFAWVIPLQRLPTFGVGSQPLFTNVLNATVPTYGFNRVFDACGAGPPSLTTAAGGGTGGAAPPAGEGDNDKGPEVVLQETVGAFEVTVLQGGTSAEVMKWLGDNGYQQDPAAEPILGEYLAENYLFAAFKLKNGAGLGEIHPVTLRFDSNEACVPLRLTRIAAKDDMEVRTFFLSDARVVPQNYRHVLVNPLRIDWMNLASNYKDVITLAVDAEGANGHGFVTEFAGASNVVPAFGIFDAAWDASAFTTLDPTLVLDRLSEQGLARCNPASPGAPGSGSCQFSHPLVEGLLQEFLPVPATRTKEDFWGCLACNEPLIDMMAWDGSAFAKALQERIIDPGSHAVGLLGAFGYLTRMYTTISPHEMSVDPFFHQNPDLEDVPNVRIGTLRTLCDGNQWFTLPDGRQVYLGSNMTWPEFQTEMPWEEDVEQVPNGGAAMALVDNTKRIDELLAAFNAARGAPPGGGGTGSTTASTGSGGPGGSSMGPGSGGSENGGGSESGGATDGMGGLGPKGDDVVDASGCACDTRWGGAGAMGVPWLMAVGFGPRRRRRVE